MNSNSVVLDQTPRSVAFDLELQYLLMSFYKNLSGLQFQNSLYRHSLFLYIKSCINYFISGVEFTALKYVYYYSISYDIVKFMTRASS